MAAASLLGTFSLFYLYEFCVIGGVWSISFREVLDYMRKYYL